MPNQLAVYQDFSQLSQVADALYKSGYFSDVKSMAQAVVKVMAGAELGIPPFASMTGINIVQGKPALGANVIATLVKNDPRYDYRVVKCDTQECILEWYENGKKYGTSNFTIQEAQAAGLTSKDVWKKYPSDLLFARALTRGARRFAPGIFGGSPVYTPDELGADVDPEGYIDAQSVTVHDPEPTYPPEARQMDDEENEPTLEVIAMRLVELKVVENAFHARGALKSLECDGLSEEDAIKRVRIYRAWRDHDPKMSKDDCKTKAIAGELPQ